MTARQTGINQLREDTRYILKGGKCGGRGSAQREKATPRGQMSAKLTGSFSVKKHAQDMTGIGWEADECRAKSFTGWLLIGIGCAPNQLSYDQDHDKDDWD
ncbi:MAG: hypothetical protein R3E02_14705 [Blastomonas sp.]